jgi:DNA mismatch endonuclease (patch repair protein)
MTDNVDKSTRSRMMSGIRGKDTKPEKVIRSALHSAGFRYRVHVSDLPGKPDLVFPKYKAVILVHGCFWHRHTGCWWSTTPSSNKEFWTVKFAQNVRRDAHDIRDLRKLGWRIAVVWECALRLPRKNEVASVIATWLKSESRSLTLPPRSTIRRRSSGEVKSR